MPAAHRGNRRRWHPWVRIHVWRLWAVPFEWAFVAVVAYLVFK